MERGGGRSSFSDKISSISAVAIVRVIAEIFPLCVVFVM